MLASTRLPGCDRSDYSLGHAFGPPDSVVLGCGVGAIVTGPRSLQDHCFTFPY